MCLLVLCVIVKGKEMSLVDPDPRVRHLWGTLELNLQSLANLHNLQPEVKALQLTCKTMKKKLDTFIAVSHRYFEALCRITKTD